MIVSLPTYDCVPVSISVHHHHLVVVYLQHKIYFEVTFHSLALGLGETTGSIVAGIPEVLLRAICLGAVFFGSMTYIGNGPNFMVKAVAEENNIKMPHFFAYMYKFSLLVLLPIFILVQLLIL